VDIECVLRLLNDENVEYRDNTHPPVGGSVSADALHQDTMGWLRDLVAQPDAACGASAISLLGRHLYETVFRGEIRTNFEATFKAFEEAKEKRQPGRLRLILEFHSQARASLPWEFLYLQRPDRPGFFLAGQIDELVLVRLVARPADGMAALGWTPSPPPLRVLLVVSRTDGLPGLDTDTLLEYFHRLRDSGVVDLSELLDPTYREFEQTVRPEESAGPGSTWHVVHFVGHGDPGVLYLKRSPAEFESAEDEAQRDRAGGAANVPVLPYEQVRTSKIRELFASQQPRLVFLQSCHGAGADSQVLYGLARDLVSDKVPAVVAMQYGIAAGTANAFAECFYNQLVAGETIGAAVTEGRRHLARRREGEAWANRDFGTPVVYLRVDDNAIVVPKVADAARDSPKVGPAASTTVARPAERMCLRCGLGVRYKACARCRWLVDCPRCGEPFEYVQSPAYCGNCCEEHSQPAYDGERTDPRPAADPGAAPDLRVLPGGSGTGVTPAGGDAFWRPAGDVSGGQDTS
jgi:hypothetical protein